MQEYILCVVEIEVGVVGAKEIGKKIKKNSAANIHDRCCRCHYKHLYKTATG